MILYHKKLDTWYDIKNVIFLKGSLFEPIRNLFTTHCSLFIFDLIISNPPYIKRDDINNLQPEIKDWEPVESLDGGKNGLDYYRVIVPEARDYLREGGHLILEMGAEQSNDVKKIAVKAGFSGVSLIKDYAGIERILIARV